MKTTKQGIIAACALIFASAVPSFAIEGLTLSLQCSNVVLSWPSTPGQNYIVQYRPTLDPSTPWVTYATGGPVNHGGVTYDDTIPDDVPYFISNFLFYWSLENGRLTDSISYGRDNTPNPGGPGNREAHWVIYGYDALRIDEVNHATDTW
jgi:hypothetical protein